MSLVRYGRSICSGLAFGTIQIYHKNNRTVDKTEVSNIHGEVHRFQSAIEKAKKELSKLYDKTLLELGPDSAAVFEAHRMIFNDPDFTLSVIGTIREQRLKAETAVKKTADHYISLFSSTQDEMIRARTADIEDISNRLIDILLNNQDENSLKGEKIIIVAEDLTPGELMNLDLDLVQGIVMQKGSANSHMAILAKNRNIPTVIQVDVKPSSEFDQSFAALDGDSGTFYIEPEEKVLTELRAKYKSVQEEAVELRKLIGEANITKDGRRLELYANVSSIEDVYSAMEQDAHGIGLFRSEYLFIGKSDYPSEEEQFQAYQKAVEIMSGRPVILRTLDIGSDKTADYFQLDYETNPAMGFRGIRICLERKEIFKTQLRAMYRASAFGNIAIMLSMIISTEEIKAVKKIITEVKNELTKEELPFGKVELGVMIETPAAALISDELACEVEFFSIGTNDLTQYALAADRQNIKLSNTYDSHHPAILRMIEMTVKNAHDKGIRVGICGELATDLDLMETFLNLGVDELSVSPRFILPLRKRIREICTES